jgi:hypothetical protein
MTLLGSIVLLLLGLLTGALAQDAAPGATPDSSQQRTQDKPQDKAHDPTKTPLVDREVRGRSGRDIRVLILTNVRPDCSSGPLPIVRLVAPPAHGKIAVRRGRFRATNVRQCLAIEVPALVAIYRSAPDFEGSDTVIVEIRPEQGTPQLRRVTIKVTKVDDGSNI